MTAYKTNPKLVIQKLEDKTILLDGKNSFLFTMNETASFIFRMLKINKPLQYITASLVKKYEITESRAKKDILALQKDLLKKNILLPVKKKNS